MSRQSCELSPRTSSDAPGTRHLPPPVASAWEIEVERSIAEATHATPPTLDTGAEEAVEAPPISPGQRLGDYGLLALAAVAAATLLAVALANATPPTLGVLPAAALAAVALVAAHLLLLARRRSRAAEQGAARARVELALRARVVASEARHVRLAAFSELAAQIAHEVRNPLSAIVLNAELLEDELHACIHASPEVKRLARAVSAEAERLTELTNEYLTFARLPRVSSRPQPLAPMLEEVAHFSRSEAERSNVTLVLELDPAAEAAVDQRLIRQVLLNLMRNAIDAMPDGGRLTLRTSVEDGRVLVDVADTGPGVPAALQESVFEPFFSTKTHGTGLGLAVARKVARDHGGDLRILPSPGGAWFRFDLPAVDSTPADGEAAPAPVETPLTVGA